MYKKESKVGHKISLDNDVIIEVNDDWKYVLKISKIANKLAKQYYLNSFNRCPVIANFLLLALQKEKLYSLLSTEKLNLKFYRYANE